MERVDKTDKSFQFFFGAGCSNQLLVQSLTNYSPVKSARKFQLWSILSLRGQVNRLWSSFELVGDRRLCTCSESVCHCEM